MLDFNRARGFNEWYVPFMANSNSLLGTGQLPKFEDDLFKRVVETTVWGITDDKVILKQGTIIPINRIYYSQ